MGVGEMHAGQHLANRVNGLFHLALLCRRTTGRDLSCSLAESKELKQWDGVGACQEEGVSVELLAESAPDLPQAITGSCFGSCDSQGMVTSDKIEITFKFRLGGRWCCCHNFCEGKQS